MKRPAKPSAISTTRAGFIALTFIALLAICVDWPALRIAAQSDALIPTTLKNQPDPAILSLQTMRVDISIDNQHATVRVLQVFENHVNQILEGKYLFALPVQGSISDFAIWDSTQRLPGVMMEKRRANHLYSGIKQQLTDPGLLQQDDEHGGASAFTAKVFPIPAYGAKRVELEYTEMLLVEELSSRFSFPLKASFGSPQSAGQLQLNIEVISDAPISPLQFNAATYPLRAVKVESNHLQYEFAAQNIELKEDLSFSYGLKVNQSSLGWIAHRAPERISAYDLRDPALVVTNPDGYFAAQAIFNEGIKTAGDRAATTDAGPRNVLLLLDTSLSMHGEKLARAVESVDCFLHGLQPQDHFNLVLFNSSVTPLSASPLAATPDNVERALELIRNSMLGGGTDLQQALLKSIELANNFLPGEHSVVLISDANATLKNISAKRIAQSFNQANNLDSSGAVAKARLYALAIGSDADTKLLEELTRQSRGYFAQARETEEISIQLKIIAARLGRPSIDGLQFASADPKNFSYIYPLQSPHSFDGSGVAFVGRYKKAAREIPVRIEGRVGDKTLTLARPVALPELEPAHDHLPRLWARARVDALLYEMNLNGEREDYIAEIIRLSQKYKFVTPYTAFLAAPRSLLRPRVIQPGDPVIRVKTDPAIKQVFAVLPFGETLPLKFVPNDNVWEARFLAPAWMVDGVYQCRLLMSDDRGNSYQEEKSFVVDSYAPRLSARLQSSTVHAGDEINLRVNADSDTARLIAKIYGASPVALTWSEKEQANVGRVRVPAGLVSGQYAITISAEDFAHNQSSIELQLSVIGR